MIIVALLLAVGLLATCLAGWRRARRCLNCGKQMTRVSKSRYHCGHCNRGGAFRLR